jgi:SAM-dependent methyltransferase
MSECETAEFFDSYAGDFDAIYGTRHTLLNRFINRHFRQSMRLRYERTIAGCRPIADRSVLDVGCGPGHYAIELARLGASNVHGLDFAPAMIDLARRHAAHAGVSERCEFEVGDFVTRTFDRTYDYVVVMGVMDYLADPQAMVDKVLSLTGSKAFFSFPVDGGLLAWQRKLRYLGRCPLYMYSEDRMRRLFGALLPGSLSVDRIARDFFVSASR